jgi:hypothetical protein
MTSTGRNEHTRSGEGEDLRAAVARVVADTRAGDPERAAAMSTAEILAEVRRELDHDEITGLRTRGDMDPTTAGAYRKVLDADVDHLGSACAADDRGAAGHFPPGLGHDAGASARLRAAHGRPT